MLRLTLALVLGALAVAAPLVYAGPQLASDLRVGGNWTLAVDLAVKESKCTRYYFLISTCGVEYVNRHNPALAGDSLNYIVFGSWAGERATLLRSTQEPGRVGSTLGLEHMRQRLATFGVFVALALAYVTALLRFLLRSEGPHEPVVQAASFEEPPRPNAARSFGRRTTRAVG